jgi:DNA repair exonuclease SbcCD ATPase subunit
MSKPNLRLATGESPPRSPEREQLAEAIAKRNDANRELGDIEAALLRARNTVDAATIAVAEKTKALETAKGANADYLARAALGRSGDVPPPSVQEARIALQDAQDKLDAARSTVALFENNRQATVDEVSYAERDVDRSAEAVVKASTEIRALVGRLKTSYAELVDVRNALRAMQSRLPDDLKILGSVDIPSIHQDDLKLAATWRTAVAALASDADALLPTN